MSKHTPGPWFVGVSADDDQLHCIDAFDASRGKGNLEVCKVWGTGQDTKESVESVANARLIAAAPDLLEALETLVNLVHEGRGLDHASKVARAAIAKARGGQP